jgi:polar amino acid transport system substrate-binding protein
MKHPRPGSWLAAGYLTLILASGLARAQSQPQPLPTLYVLVDSSTEMPHAQISNDAVVDGLARDLGLQLGARLGRSVIFRALPRRRLADTLVAGAQADLLCHFMPAWLPGQLHWSQPFLPDAALLISTRPTPAPSSLAELADQPIGTISGFVYPELEAALGARFRREDAPNLQANLRKLGAGRMRHAVVGRSSLDYLMRHKKYPLMLQPPLLISSFKTQCALSTRSPVSLAELNAAITALQADGGLQRLLDRYR